MGRMVDVDTLMTDAEHEAMELSGLLANALGKIIKEGGEETGQGDWAEAAHHIHLVQHQIMANCAARAFPNRYRPLGGKIKEGLT